MRRVGIPGQYNRALLCFHFFIDMQALSFEMAIQGQDEDKWLLALLGLLALKRKESYFGRKTQNHSLRRFGRNR